MPILNSSITTHDTETSIKWLRKYPLRYALGRSWLTSCNPPSRSADYRSEEPDQFLPTQSPSSALETLKSVFPVLRRRHDRLSLLSHDIEGNLRELSYIEASPFTHIVNRFGEPFYLKLALVIAIIVAIIYINF